MPDPKASQQIQKRLDEINERLGAIFVKRQMDRATPSELAEIVQLRDEFVGLMLLLKPSSKRRDGSLWHVQTSSK